MLTELRPHQTEAQADKRKRRAQATARWRVKHREKYLASKRISYAENAESRRADRKKYYYENIDKSKAYTAQWRVKNAALIAEKRRIDYEKNREQRLARAKRYMALNPLAVAARKAAYRAKNRERVRRESAEWKKANPESARVYRQRRRARKLAAGGEHTASDLKEILCAQKNRCAYCRAKIVGKNCHIDHIKPLARGGSNDRQNLQFLCADCNHAKHAKDPIIFAQQRGMLL